MPKLSELHKYEALKNLSVSQWKSFQASLAIQIPDTMKVLDNSTFVGIEVEVENITGFRNGDWSALWNAKEDHSLRDHGMEFISHPMKGDCIPTALLLLDKCLEERARFSPRTSVHVHINVRDLEPSQIARIALVYLTLEKAMFKYAGEHREKNIFCVPLYALQMTDTLFHSLMNMDKKELRRIQVQELRYSALNFEPLFTFGTIEFRHLGGTRDAQTVLTWVNLILSIKKYALSKGIDDLIREILALNTNSQYRGYAQQVFQDLFFQIPNEMIEQGIEEGVFLVKRTLLSNNFYDELVVGRTPNSPAIVARQKLNDVLLNRSTNVGERINQAAPRPIRIEVNPNILNLAPINIDAAYRHQPQIEVREGRNYIINQHTRQVIVDHGDNLEAGRELPRDFWELTINEQRNYVEQAYRMERERV